MAKVQVLHSQCSQCYQPHRKTWRRCIKIQGETPSKHSTFSSAFVTVSSCSASCCSWRGVKYTTRLPAGDTGDFVGGSLGGDAGAALLGRP